ncbi:MAG: rhomboid family intramembrane serine protease [Spirochaetota bacterium]
MHLRYNAPVTLTFALVCTLVLAINQLLFHNLIQTFFSVPGKGAFSFSTPISYIRLISHIIGHGNWAHLLANFSFILLLGPILEEKYSSLLVLLMMFITALVTGLLNSLLFSAGLLGASGIVFMMILLVSFTNIKQGEIPLTFILVVALFLTKEVINSFTNNSISEFAHILGGICGSLFGFARPNRPAKTN